MDRDFHYYGTYLAAWTAGYNNKQARAIATSAQYIDDCTEKATYTTNAFKINQQDEYIFRSNETNKVFRPMVTSVYGMTSWAPTSNYDETRQIWEPFHFLPGNYPHQQSMGEGLELRNPGYINSSMEESQKDIRVDCDTGDGLLTRPNSDAAQNMVNETRKIVSQCTDKNTDDSQKSALNLIGCCMHVFADTYAHQDFAGTFSTRLNGVYNSIGSDPGKFTIYGEWKDDEWYPKENTYRDIVWPKDVVSWDPLTVYSTVNSSYTSLGHGQMGHIPDVSTVAFKYRPDWQIRTAEEITRNNPTTYLQAFKKMVIALYCIKNSAEFSWSLDISDNNGRQQSLNRILDVVKNLIAPSIKDRNDTLAYDKGLCIEGSTWFLTSEQRWGERLAELCNTENDQYRDVPGYNKAKEGWASKLRSDYKKGGYNENQPMEKGTLIKYDFVNWNIAAKALFRINYLFLRYQQEGRVRICRNRSLSKSMNPAFNLVNELDELYLNDSEKIINARVLSAMNSDQVDMALRPVQQVDYTETAIKYGDLITLKINDCYVTNSNTVVNDSVNYYYPRLTTDVSYAQAYVIYSASNDGAKPGTAIKHGDEVVLQTKENTVGPYLSLSYAKRTLQNAFPGFDRYRGSDEGKWKIAIVGENNEQLYTKKQVTFQSLKDSAAKLANDGTTCLKFDTQAGHFTVNLYMMKDS
ncbi:DUF6765 family protein [Gynuella sunshinyii]|uniref:Uncharacterized protein n=1 Tax=Gynuella sunshinyii YC6258 TaxID=1445510 RepID=A0A0C5VH15_9GAMM|nr:DUF6765 family protein [Gynuella sunshinyii]AJQ93526.1 hypothetical Protein YC6258_01478 [Gynuella sunshinyii YC6258]